MKKLLRIPLLLVAMLLSSIPLSAHDFEVDGIYYNITSSTDKTVAVSFRGDKWNSYSNEYTGSVVIPEAVTYSGTTYSVTSIGNDAFGRCTGLTSVTIPNSVTSISASAFYGCTGLTTVNFNATNCTTMGSLIYPVFNGCTALTTLNIGDNVTNIPSYAFNGCTGLTSVTIPNSVTSIGGDAFWDCTNLTTVNFNATNCTTMGSSSYPVFSGCTKFTTLNIGDNVTNIPSYAFYRCTGLTSVTIPNSVTKIGPEAFYGCTGLTTVNFNATNCTSMGSSSYPVFEGCTAFKTLNIGDNVTNIPYYAFYGCTDLTSVTIPNSVTSIGKSAFNGCTGLTSVTIPNSVTSIGGDAFWDCTNLTTVNFNATNCTTMGSSSYPVFSGCTKFTTLNIGDNVTNIPSYAFYRCTDLTSVTIPNSVTSIGKSAFSGCTGLTTVNFNATNCTTMGSSSYPVFSGCTAFKTLNIGDNVTNIPEYAFSGCTGLTTVNFNATNCTSMGSLIYPVFNGCTALTTLNIGDNVTNIPSYAFNGCTGLTSVTIPESVTSIGSSAFSGCTGLTSVNISDLSAWSKIDFATSNANPLYYAGKLVLNGSEVTNLVIPSDITKIKSYTFYNCTGLTSVTIPESVTTIGESAFSGCTDLTSVTIPNSVTSIGSSAFYNCSNLASLSGGENLSSIGNYAFWGCKKLINANVTRTQTTATINLTSPTQYNLGLYYNNSDKMQAENGVVKFTGLKPGSTISSYDLALIINGIYCPIKDLSFTTRSFSASVTGSATTTSVSAIGRYTDGDMTILGEGINYGSSVTNYDGNNTITVNNLDPNTSHTIYYAVKIQEGGGSVYTASKSFTTGDLTWSNGGFTATSTTSARLSVETNCDATAGTGFEWKRYDAPESLAPSKAPCPVVDGMLVGSLRNLNPDVYYKCRPYYTSSSGNTYYGEWITFFTGDANVYFEPEVRTFSERSVVNNSVTVRGYALPGTDDISEQGFEYWKVPASRATATVMTVKASGISMTATLADLEYNSTYRYRAYVKTAQGTFYGEEEEFSTGEDPAGIEYIEVDDITNFDVMLRENPATATAWVKVAGTSAIEAEYYILTTNGGMVANGFIPADGEYQPIELNIANGLYLMTVTDGSHRKTLRLIVR